MKTHFNKWNGQWNSGDLLTTIDVLYLSRSLFFLLFLSDTFRASDSIHIHNSEWNYLTAKLHKQETINHMSQVWERNHFTCFGNWPNYIDKCPPFHPRCATVHPHSNSSKHGILAKVKNISDGRKKLEVFDYKIFRFRKLATQTQHIHKLLICCCFFFIFLFASSSSPWLFVVVLRMLRALT